eukprot:3319431-Rhodomonas_salina.1
MLARVESEIHTDSSQAVAPTRILTLSSKGPKKFPDMVVGVLACDGWLEKLTETFGARKEKAASSPLCCPPAVSTTSALAPSPCETIHRVEESDIQEEKKHAVPLTDAWIE